MSSTYVVGKAAAACVDERGTVYYLLHEKSYESNVHPQVPKWSVRHFGTYESCLARTIRVSSAIEGGCLRGDARTPSAYIRHWREKFEQPMQMHKGLITKRFGAGFYDLPLGQVDAVNALLRAYGFTAVDGNQLSIDMNDDGALALLADLTDGRFDGIYAWQLFGGNGLFNGPAIGLGVPVPPAAQVSLSQQVFTLEPERPGYEQTHLIAGPDGTRVTAWAYSTMASFIEREVVEMERCTPGSAEPAIRAFRKIMKGKRPLPPTYTVSIQCPGDDVHDRWHRECFSRLCAELQVREQAMLIVGASKLTPAAVREIGYLGDAYVTFRDGGRAVSAMCDQQLDLLAELEA